eukprot:g2751.t1
MKVTVVGACGGIGQPLSLLMKQNPSVTELALYDVVPAAGVAADVSHVDTQAVVTGYSGDAEMSAALHGADVVVIPAGVPRKPGMTRDDLFSVNAGIIQGIARKIAVSCPRAMVLVITNPVNTTVPIVAETLRQAGVYDPRRLVGVTTLDIQRSKAFVGAALGEDPRGVTVDVVGGHSGTTIVPILSRVGLPASQHDDMTKKIQNAGSVVVEAKAGKGSATLSMAAAAAFFAGRVISALQGAKGVRECCYVAQDAVPGLQFFAHPVTFGPGGVESIHDITKNVSGGEAAKIREAVGILEGQIKKGVDFARSKL